MPALGRLGQISCRDHSPLPPCYPQASSKQPARGREGTSEARSPGCSWDEPWDESFPLPPLLGHTVELCHIYFLVRCCYQKNLRMSEGRGRIKERGGNILGGVTISDMQSPREEGPWSLSLALALVTLGSAQSYTPSPTGLCQEAAVQSCEESGMRGREEEGYPRAAHSQLWQEGRVGRVWRRQRQEGDLEAEAGQRKGRALGTKAHLRIYSASAEPPGPGHHGTAAGHGSV